jgi:hypothetical protein
MKAGRSRVRRHLLSSVEEPTPEPAPPKVEVENSRESGSEFTPESAGFDEQRYLAAFPDIKEDVRQGLWESGQAHYIAHAMSEGRLIDPAYLGVLPSNRSAEFPLCHIDTALISRSRWCLVMGWISDESERLRAVAWSKNGEIDTATDCFARYRRQDAESTARASEGTLLGFWTMFHSKVILSPSDNLQLHVWVENNQKAFEVSPRFIDDRQLRDHALEHLARARYFTNSQVESFRQLKGGLGKALLQHNTQISQAIVQEAHVMRFGEQARHLEGSIIVCLFGKPEYLFLQAAAFSACPGMESYELVYVSNSPELAERLSHEATMASRIYDIGITLIILSGNAGFGAANNVAVQHARSDRILIVNPDVFPRDRDWAARHSSVVTNLPAEQTRIFGVPLYYDDGSLMHGGMYFDFDTGLSIHDGRIEQQDMIRVEHYGKGAPPETSAFLDRAQCRR